MAIASAVVVKQDTLETAVLAEAKAGMRDPVEIVARLSERHGQAWLLRQLIDVVARIVTANGIVIAAPARRARPPARRAGAQELEHDGLPRVRKAAGAVAGDFFASLRWVSPETGWKPVAALTAADCRMIAAQYDLLADVARQHRRWFEDAAAAIEQAGVETIGDAREILAAPAAALPAGQTL